MAAGALILAGIVALRWIRGTLVRSPRVFLLGAILLVVAAGLSLWDAIATGVHHPTPPQPLAWARFVLFDAPLLLWFVLALRYADRRAAEEAELRDIAARDPLTASLNRRGLADEGAQMLAAARRGRHKVGLLAIDLDHFKLLNDREGHAAGDAVLRLVADTIRGLLRCSDVLGRAGGDEFVVLLADSDGMAAREAAERLLAALTAALAPTGVGASIGVTVVRRRERMEDALARADAALYRAKKEGRGRIAIAPDAAGRLRLPAWSVRGAVAGAE